MSISMAIFTFINVWWISLFFVLPLGVEKDGHHLPANYIGAPKNVDWKKKLIQTSLIAAAITGILALIINSGIVQIR